MKKSVFLFIIYVSSVFFSVKLFGISTAAETSGAEYFEVASVFSDHMVFQQNEPIRVWGTGSGEGSTVYATLGESYGQSDIVDGKWEIVFAPRAYSAEPLTLEIYSGPDSQHRVFEDILIGDVWLFIGQSNIEYSFGGLEEYDELDRKAETMRNVRFLSFGSDDLEKLSDMPDIKEENGNSASDGLMAGKRWNVAGHGENVNASALGLCFSSELNALSGEEVPIGMISLGFAGKSLSAFVSPEISSGMSGYDDKSTVYESFIKPFINFPIRGVVWYQGEADAAYYAEYADALYAFIKEFRSEKNQSEYETVPFYIVELPPCFPAPAYAPQEQAAVWQYIDFGNVRSASGILPSMAEKCYICTTSDLWSDTEYPNNLHPPNKRDTAARLARMAAANEWGFSEFDSLVAPTVNEIVQISDDGKEVEVAFESNGRNLAVYGDTLTGFDAVGKDWNPMQVSAELVSENRVRIKAPEEIYILRYGAGTSSVFGKDTSLCNDAGIPAAAFSLYLKEFPVPFTEQLRVAAVKFIGCLYPFRAQLCIFILFLLVVLTKFFIIKKTFTGKRGKRQ